MSGVCWCRADPRNLQPEGLWHCHKRTGHPSCSRFVLLTQKRCPAGSELFFFLTLWCLIVVLPTNYSVSLGSCCLHETLLCMG